MTPQRIVAMSMRLILSATLLVLLGPALPADDDVSEHDVVIYGGTAAGIVAAVQVARMGRSPIVIEPTNRIGGLTTGGLGQTDIGNKSAIGGISREFYQRIAAHYQSPSAWKWQTPESYRSQGQSRTLRGETSMWTFEPSAALAVLQDLVREHQIDIIFAERLDRSGSTATGMLGSAIEKVGTEIRSIRMESGRVFRGRRFIDCTYEGDLLATAGVSYTVGREPNDRYGETLNGVQAQRAIHHQFYPNVDPYVEKGNPGSGLLPGIDPGGPGNEGGGDLRVQAFCFRSCLTDHPENRIPFAKPAGYNPLNYELLLRNFESGLTGFPAINSAMPNRKTDTNNRTGFSTDFIGQNYRYPEASYAEREQIVAAHRTYQQGLFWTLANHERVPEGTRTETNRWGTCKDEFARADGWQQQLYIREARRMIGGEVMTQHHCQGRETVDDSVGMAAYTMDSHNVQRYVDNDGHVRNEGDVQVGGFPPYPISFSALLPKSNECTNLLVPVCLSATHIAFGSIRMEPVFMVLGQSAATAAVESIEQDCALQQLPYAKLQTQLLRDGQVLERDASMLPPEGLAVEDLEGAVVDDSAATLRGFDGVSHQIGPFVGSFYRHDGNAAKDLQSAEYEFNIANAGQYTIRLSYTSNPNRATNVPVAVSSEDRNWAHTINQKLPPEKDGFATVMSSKFEPGRIVVRISNQNTNGYVVIDAVQLIGPVTSDD
ncbi:MAG: FAD-dependent oxidoreductase [Rubripirellula sp.]